MTRDNRELKVKVVMTSPATKDRKHVLTASLKQIAFVGILFCALGSSLYVRVFLPISLWSINSKTSPQCSSGFLFFTSELIDTSRNSSFSILVSEMSFLSSSANAEVYADIPLRPIVNDGQAFFAVQTPGTAKDLHLLSIFSGQDLNEFNGTAQIIILEPSGISYMVVLVPKNNVSENLSLHAKFSWNYFSYKISVNEYAFTASFDTTISQSFNEVKSTLGLSDVNVFLPEAATTYRFSLARPSKETLTQIMPNPDNIVFNGSSVWLLWDINQRSDSKRFVSTAVTIQAENQGEKALYDLSLTFFLFLIGLGIPLVISALFEYTKLMQSTELKLGALKRPTSVSLLFFGATIVMFEVLRFFSILDPFGRLHGVFILLLEICFYVSLGFWLGEVGFSSIGTSAMISILIAFDQVMYFRNVMDVAVATWITCSSFILGALIFLTAKRIKRRTNHIIEVYGSLLNPKEWRGQLAEGDHTEIGKEKRVGWKLSFDKQSSQRKETVLNLVHTDCAEDIYFTTLFKVDDAVYEAISEREMGKNTYQKWKKGEKIANTSYRPVELDSKFGKVVIFIIPESGRVRTPATEESSYVKIVTEGIEFSYAGEMKDTNLKALEGAIRESKPKN